jgi:hypothetical protein
LEHVKHLRTINFVIVFLSVGAIILATGSGEPVAEKALTELKGIRSFVQAQESGGPFGSLWLRRRLLSEYGEIKIDPKQPLQGAVRSVSGQELDCFHFFSLGFPGSLLDPTSLDSVNASLIESVLSASEPVKTVAQWRRLWDGLRASDGQIYWVQEVVFDRAEILIVNHPTYKRSALGTTAFTSLVEVVKSSSRYEGAKWVWGPCKTQPGTIKSQFIFLRPSANHTRTEYTHAFWLFLFDRPDLAIPRYGPSWNWDAFYFLHIPVRVQKLSRDFQALIAREANRDWPAGTFGRSFPGLEQTLGDSSEIPFDQAEKILGNFAKLEARALRRLSLGGFELAGAPILPVTLLVLVAAQIYFLLHFRYFLRHHGDETLDFPWIALYPSPFAIFVFLLTCIAPACAALVLGHQVGGMDIWMIGFFNIMFSVVACWIFLKWSWPRYKPLSASQ